MPRTSRPSDPSSAATVADAPAAPTKSPADPAAAIVSLVVFFLSAFKIPTLLHLTVAATTAIGSAVVLTAAFVRGYFFHYRKGEEVAIQDLAAAAVGAIFLALSLAGVPNAMPLDADTAGMLGSALVTALTFRRAVKPAA